MIAMYLMVALHALFESELKLMQATGQQPPHRIVKSATERYPQLILAFCADFEYIWHKLGCTGQRLPMDLQGTCLLKVRTAIHTGWSAG